MNIKVAIPAWVLAVAVQFQAIALEQPDTLKVTSLLKTETTWHGEPIRYPDGQAEVSGFLFEIAPGARTGWHLHPRASFAYMLEGELEVRLKSGESRRFTSGDAFAEVIDTLHEGHNVGSGPVRIVVFYVGAVGDTLTVRENTAK